MSCFPLYCVAEQHYVIALCNLQCLELTGQFAAFLIPLLEVLFCRSVQAFPGRTKKAFSVRCSRSKLLTNASKFSSMSLLPGLHSTLAIANQATLDLERDDKENSHHLTGQ